MGEVSFGMCNVPFAISFRETWGKPRGTSVRDRLGTRTRYIPIRKFKFVSQFFLHCIDYMTSNVRNMKKAVVACFNLLSQHLPKGTEEIQKYLVRITGFRALDVPDNKTEALTIYTKLGVGQMAEAKQLHSKYHRLSRFVGPLSSVWTTC
jgi:hypothetical protein